MWNNLRRCDILCLLWRVYLLGDYLLRRLSCWRTVGGFLYYIKIHAVISKWRLILVLYISLSALLRPCGRLFPLAYGFIGED